ncbi:MAG: MerR family transcriptional regulator [Lachnospiraceae bacterium]|nr:MerR family transcriptional regulator [Lachnospiraceae bacterium]
MKDVIGQTGLTEKAIRLYIDKKLIMPIIEEKGNRNNVFFSDEQITELKQIGVLRLFDFSMQEIEVLLHGTKGEQKEILLECKKRSIGRSSF